MHKKRLHQTVDQLQWLKPWHFLVLAALTGAICVGALRANNEHMAHLRTALYQADQKDQNVQGALQALQSYVTSHMNTNLSSGSGTVYPPIQLVGTYDRLVQAQGATIQKQNSQLYTDAQNYCEQLYPNSLNDPRPRVPCIEQYVQGHGLKTPPAIPDSLYKFDFVSPSWSPDLAGWSLGVAVLWVILAASWFIIRRLAS
ncbi:MAG TPA: hypothetical protein VFN56_01335 [Candidatus Saccharimonadales bacterium]|nr:hypothetical protein [Candidatus Saccharimonadales bacterium]